MKKINKECYVIWNYNNHCEDELDWFIYKKVFTLFDGNYYYEQASGIGYSPIHCFSTFQEAKSYIIEYIKKEYGNKYNCEWLFENYLKHYIDMKEQ